MVWTWLTHHGLYEAAVSWLVFFGLGTVLVGLVKWRVKKLFHRRPKLADTLNPRTPGGLGDVAEALDHKEPKV